jgi:alkanesulfonate monooxygenase SsuD/methylene tetrahydromethanopterin reductase-like flavin-dependent oxidoreductase (luciferase family)
MIAAGVCAAETDAEAAFLRSSQILAFARLRTGRPGKLPAPTHDLSEIPPPVMAGVQAALSCSAIGAPQTVKAQLRAILTRYQPDELIISGMIHDPTARLRSFEIAAKALHELRDERLSARADTAMA